VTTKEYFQPASVAEAVGLLDAEGPTLLVMAGGTIAMPLVNEGISMPEKVLGLRRAGLNYVHRENGTFVIGATTTLTQMLAQDEIPLLREAAANVGGWAIRNMGTVGGNLFAPPPAGDFAVALLALDATVVLAGANGERELPLEEFYTGFLMTALAPGELLKEIRVPLPKGATAYLKFGRKHANTPAVVTVAAHLVLDVGTVKEARLALNAVGPYPIRAVQAERALLGSRLDEAGIAAAAEAGAGECQPFTDAIASEWYRRKMAAVYVRRTLEKIAGMAA
jgi:CO/xanthine dehydrogenase FAD-binding subunit